MSDLLTETVRLLELSSGSLWTGCLSGACQSWLSQLFSVPCCVQQLCTEIRTHTWPVLTIDYIGY